MEEIISDSLTCVSCDETDAENFYEYRKHQCKSCHAEYVRGRRDERREFMNAYKVEHGCQDCGGKFPSHVLDFDHVRGEKLMTIGETGDRNSWEKLLAEIEKCEVVCANCHRERTYARNYKR